MGTPSQKHVFVHLQEDRTERRPAGNDDGCRSRAQDRPHCSVGVGLKEGEVAELDRIVEDLDITRNALMRYAIRYFLTQYNAGSVNLAKDVESPETKKRLKMP